MRKVVKYEILSQRDLAGQIEDVNKHIHEGWELLGRPYSAKDEQGLEFHYQAMVQYETI